MKSVGGDKSCDRVVPEAASWFNGGVDQQRLGVYTAGRVNFKPSGYGGVVLVDGVFLEFFSVSLVILPSLLWLKVGRWWCL